MQQVRTKVNVFWLGANFVTQHLCFDTTLPIRHVGENFEDKPNFPILSRILVFLAF